MKSKKKIQHLRLAAKNTREMLLDKILTDSITATEVVTMFCRQEEIRIPFSFVKFGKMYATHADIKDMRFYNNTTVLQAVSHQSDLFQKLGSIRVEDNSWRKEILDKPMLLVTWLHSPSSVALLLYMYNDDFREYIGVGNRIMYKGLKEYLKQIHPAFKQEEIIQLELAV